MRDVQNVDTGRTPRFRSRILRVDDRAQDAESFAKMRAHERVANSARVRIVGALEISAFLNHHSPRD